MTLRPNTDLGVLRVKTNDPDNLHFHKGELVLVAGTLTQGVIINSKNSKTWHSFIAYFSESAIAS